MVVIKKDVYLYQITIKTDNMNTIILTTIVVVLLGVRRRIKEENPNV